MTAYYRRIERGHRRLGRFLRPLFWLIGWLGRLPTDRVLWEQQVGRSWAEGLQRGIAEAGMELLDSSPSRVWEDHG